MRDRFISRREALTLALAAAGSLVRPAGAARCVSAAGQSGAGPGVGGSRLVIRNARPLDAESPIEALRTFETRNDLFFVRSHLALPTEIATAWTLAIDGEVAPD
jgi:DMSO/TMAO reductase YedYZ molybdopterin-dependent catalytic subunit